MNKKETSIEELNAALAYLDSFSKGIEAKPVEGEQKPAEEKKPEGEQKPEGEADAEPDDELYMAHKKKMAAYIDKAMCHKGYMDSIKKGDPLPDEAFDDLDDEVPAKPEGEQKPSEEKPAEGGEKKPGEGEQKPAEEVKKGLEDNLFSQDKIDELVKAKVSAELDSVKAGYEEIIKGNQDKIAELEAKINEISDQPVRKTLIKGADAVTLKAAISGEKIDDKTVLSLSLQKSKVSDVLFKAYEEEKNEMTKGILGEAVSQFECTGNYISSEVAQIMESKGFRFIK